MRFPFLQLALSDCENIILASNGRAMLDAGTGIAAP